MVLSGRKLLIGVILILALGLSLVALNRIVRQPAPAEIPSVARIDSNQNRALGAGSYFAEHRMIRERNRSRQVELLEKIVNNEKMDSQNKARAARDLIILAEISEKERLAEETVKAVGYQDCVVLIRDNAALAVVATNNLSKSREQVLADQLAEILKFKAENITVMARPMGKITS